MATHSTDAAYSAVVKDFQHVFEHSERACARGRSCRDRNGGVSQAGRNTQDCCGEVALMPAAVITSSTRFETLFFMAKWTVFQDAGVWLDCLVFGDRF